MLNDNGSQECGRLTKSMMECQGRRRGGMVRYGSSDKNIWRSGVYRVMTIVTAADAVTGRNGVNETLVVF